MSVSGKGAKARAVTASTAPRLAASIASTRLAWIAAAAPVSADRLAQESALALVAFDAMDDGAGNVGELDCDHEAGKAGPGTHVDPAAGPGRKGEELGRIGDVAGPDGGEGRFCDEIGLVSPAGEEIDIGREALPCFT